MDTKLEGEKKKRFDFRMLNSSVCANIKGKTTEKILF